ncbi:8098_t:CDS:1, partial [Racocetra fulgida]
TLSHQNLAEDNQIEPLLEEFYRKYEFWLVLQQAKAREEILRMIQEPTTQLLDPTI